MKRTLAIGDIHGCHRALETLAGYADFQPEDTIVTLGDYVNRGPDSKAVIEMLLELRGFCRLIALKGNHEQMLIAARQTDLWLKDHSATAGDQLLESYGVDSVTEIPQSHWDFLNSLSLYHETENHLFVHANEVPALALDQQPLAALLCLPISSEQAAHHSGKTMICGHTSQRSGLPLNLGHAICIDTAAASGGWLTCLEVNTGSYWQANQQGEKRTGEIRRS